LVSWLTFYRFVLIKISDRVVALDRYALRV
jgi:hypothetical protein